MSSSDEAAVEKEGASADFVGPEQEQGQEQEQERLVDSADVAEGEEEDAIADKPSSQDWEEYALRNKIPVTHQVELGGHSKAVTCLSIASTGNRVVTGSLDYQMNLYDFGGMDSRHRAFRSAEVQSGHPVQSISHSPNGDRYIVATGSASPQIFDKEGQLVIKFIKGDMYIRDLTNTKGHTMEVTCCQWHPTQKDTVLTSSLDGSVRIWDLLGLAHFGDLTSKHVLKLKGQAATQTRLGATACCYSPSGNRIIGAGSDGCIYIWFEKKSYSRADLILRSDHSTGLISSIIVSPDASYLAVRALGNDCVLVWDFTSIGTKATTVLSAVQQKPLIKLSALVNEYPTANVEFSPDSKYLCCSTYSTSSSSSSSSTTSTSLLQFYDIPSIIQMLPSPNFYPLAVTVASMKIGLSANIIYVKWHAKTNQIFCSTSNGKTIVLFDERISSKGALLSAGRAAKREVQFVSDDSAAVGEIFTPTGKSDSLFALRRKERESKAAAAVAGGRVPAPAKPVTSGPGKNANNSFFFTQYLMSQGGKTPDVSRLEDPREALLKMDAAAKSDPVFMGGAYQATQPKTVLHERTFEEEQEHQKKKLKTMF